MRTVINRFVLRYHEWFQNQIAQIYSKQVLSPQYVTQTTKNEYIVSSMGQSSITDISNDPSQIYSKQVSMNQPQQQQAPTPKSASQLQLDQDPRVQTLVGQLQPATNAKQPQQVQETQETRQPRPVNKMDAVKEVSSSQD